MFIDKQKREFSTTKTSFTRNAAGTPPDGKEKATHRKQENYEWESSLVNYEWENSLVNYEWESSLVKAEQGTGNKSTVLPETCKMLVTEIKDNATGKGHTVFWVGRLNTVRVTILPRAIHRIQCNTYQVSSDIFHRTRTKSSEFVWKHNHNNL